MSGALWIFLLLTFGLTGALAAVMGWMGGMSNQYYVALAALAMLIPALSSLLTRWIAREGFGELYLKPRFRGHIGYYLLAWLAPAAMTVAGGAAYFAVFPDRFDPNMTAMMRLAAAQGVEGSAGLLFWMQVLNALLVGPLINFLPALGEELGWRGYLLPRLRRRCGDGMAVLLSGLIWGVWHAPLIALGHNYGLDYPGAPWLGILTMTAACVFLGAFLSFLSIRVGSAIPCALAHGAFNAIVGLSTFFVAAPGNPLIGPLPLSWLGGVGVMAVGALCFARVVRAEGKKRREMPRQTRE